MRGGAIQSKVATKTTCGKTPNCGNTPSRQTEPDDAAHCSPLGRLREGNVMNLMNDRLLEISAYAAFAFVFISVILAASMIADRLA
jgi:hypothetical protein